MLLLHIDSKIISDWRSVSCGEDFAVAELPQKNGHSFNMETDRWMLSHHQPQVPQGCSRLHPLISWPLSLLMVTKEQR